MAEIAAQAAGRQSGSGTTAGGAGTPSGPRATIPRAGCSLSSMLVSSCGPWLGVAPQTFSPLKASQSLSIDEQFSDTSFSVLHQYHSNGSLFPNAESIALAQQPGANRLLVENWKPATDMTWAQVADGRADARIDTEAAYLKSHFDYPFLLAIWHEPEDNIKPAAGSGMTVADYVAMYRHVVLRLRADGASKFRSVMNFMGYSKWYSITDALYPGDDVVDWIAWDPYMHDPSGAPGHDFASLVNRPKGSFPGMYDWAVTKHPGKPLMLGEWGAFNDSSAPNGQADFFNSVTAQIGRFPQLKALDYFDMNTRWVSGPGTAPDDSPSALAAWRNLVTAPVFNGVEPDYDDGTIIGLN